MFNLTRRKFSTLLTGLMVGGGEVILQSACSSAPDTQMAQTPAGGRRLQADIVQRIKLDAWISAVAISPDGTMVATPIGLGLKVIVSNIATSKPISEFKRANSLGRDTICFTADSKFIVTTPADTALNSPWAVGVWDAHSGMLAKQLPKPQVHNLSFIKIATAIQVSPDGQWVAMLAETKAIGEKFGSVALAIYLLSDGSLVQVNVAPSGAYLPPLRISSKNVIAMWWLDPANDHGRSRVATFGAASGEKIGDFEANQGMLGALAWRPDGDVLATGTGMLELLRRDPVTQKDTYRRDDDPIRSYDPKTGALLRSITGEVDPISQIVWSVDGRLLATAGLKERGQIGGAVRIWNAEDGALLFERRHSGRTPSGVIAFHPDGLHFVMSEANDLLVYKYSY